MGYSYFLVWSPSGVFTAIGPTRNCQAKANLKLKSGRENMSQNLKNDLVNIMLLGVLLFGLMLAQDSGWGFLLAGLPLAIWCFKAFAFIQRKWWLAVPFWCALTYLCWQMSLALWIGYIVVAIFKYPIDLNSNYPIKNRKKVKSRKYDSEFYGDYTSIDIDKRGHLGTGIGIPDSFDYDYRNHIGFDD
ncbi:hypothetical protein [Salmonella enterica]